VFEGEAIAHVEADGNVTVTDALAANLTLSTQSRITRAAAVAAALGFIRPIGDYEIRDASLWILPRGERSVVDRVVWHLAVAVENDLEDPAEWRYFVDAQTGSVVWSFDNLETTDAAATARTMYSGDRMIRADRVNNRYLPFKLTAGRSATIDGERLQVGFERVVSDSRCPRDAQCIVAGEGVVRVWLLKAPGARENRDLKTTPDAASAVYGTYRITLRALDPVPMTNHAIRPSEYVPTLVVSRA
jgi:hypothetical protein